MKDHLVRILTEDGSLRAAAALTTELVAAICGRQQTDPTATVALGRLRHGVMPLEILERLFAGIPFTLQGQNDLVFRCTCGRPQVRRMLQSLGGEELRQLAEREEETVVTCEFCKETYDFSRGALSLLAQAAESSANDPAL